MFTSIKTSKANKELVTQLTNKLNLGAENVIARLAFSYSLARDTKMDLQKIGDAQGKEYNIKVLFGNYADIYIALIATHYGISAADKDISKYVKMHIDDGLALINKEVTEKDTISGNDFLINEIEKGLANFY
ncbi:DndE family protein [Pedobacter punctiformis]|uniref:DndE family protein n=1 Tax=Pedobacter punctiformis TaxID=3004097 RepID=A0ABT4LC51_9SPHI|nr:DndE family protein [Pedobacter sp. HCMS5-2]MCZ4245468.1 DndE family protein [Pedobacter sp. HCMS5-2]